MNGCLSVGLLLIGLATVFFMPFFGVLCILLALFAATADNDASEIKIVLPLWKRTVDFGPGGPPWSDQEPPLNLGGRVVFASSIAKLYEEGPTPPELRKRRGVFLPVAGTERSATLWVTLHSGEQLKLTESAADRLRGWFDRLGVGKEKF